MNVFRPKSDVNLLILNVGFTIKIQLKIDINCTMFQFCFLKTTISKAVVCKVQFMCIFRIYFFNILVTLFCIRAGLHIIRLKWKPGCFPLLLRTIWFGGPQFSLWDSLSCYKKGPRKKKITPLSSWKEDNGLKNNDFDGGDGHEFLCADIFKCFKLWLIQTP